ncbi:hypothetical protein GGF37_002723 [Kickxella alabastrina]|nr:hypothetical protein GGF37_002723 [Kickxella alabastrina]
MDSAQRRLKVLLVGTGALGSVYAWRLQASGKVEITAVCRSNYAAVQQNGFLIQSAAFGTHTYRPTKIISSISNATGEIYDYVIVCTKALPNLGDNSDIIAPAVSPSTTIVLIQNGVGIEEPFARRYPQNPLGSAVAYIDASQPEQGIINHGHISAMTLGTYPPHSEHSARLTVLSEIWNQQGIPCTVVNNVQAFRWLKLVWNASFNTVAVVSGGNDTQEMLADQRCKALLRCIMLEVYRLGEAVLGEPLPVRNGVGDADAWIAETEGREVPVVPSMLMDFWAKRPMEHDVILGRPIAVARQLGIDVPHMESVYALLVMVEKQYL